MEFLSAAPAPAPIFSPAPHPALSFHAMDADRMLTTFPFEVLPGSEGIAQRTSPPLLCSVTAGIESVLVTCLLVAVTEGQLKQQRLYLAGSQSRGRRHAGRDVRRLVTLHLQSGSRERWRLLLSRLLFLSSLQYSNL